MTNLKLLVLIGILSLTLSDLCTVSGYGDGTCIATSKCSQFSGTSHKGYCKGGNDIQCRTGVKCGNDGICRAKGNGSGGTMITGKCPGQ